MNLKAEAIQVKASAGSGKTYALSRRYIEILTKLVKHNPVGKKEKNRSCRTDESGGNGLESVLAITFTNKAAAEMKERILYLLKRIAFLDNPDKLSGFDFLDSNTATELLSAILLDFSDFQVKTIDSFMNNILKAFSVDAGLFPDFKLEFDADDVFALAIETMFDTRPDLIPQLKGMLTAVLALHTQSGFDPRRLTEKLLTKLKKFENEIDFNRLSHVQQFDADSALKTLKEHGIALIQDMEKLGKGIFNGRSFAPKRHLQQIDRSNKFPDWMTDGRRLDKLKNKKAEEMALDALQEKLDTFHLLYREYLISTAVEAFRAPVQVFREYRELERQFLKELNSFEIDKMALVIHRLLSEAGAPVAFCRLGEQYSHYLVDEFQDTSRNQWNAMVPLVENSLSKGGSLFFVGDTKQAIYGWRGGDYKLFNEIQDQEGIQRPVGGNFEARFLKTNHRSAKEIIEFNNGLFSENSMKALAEKLDLTDLEEIYLGAKQDVSKTAVSGMVEAKLFQSTDREPLVEEVKEWCKEVIQDTVSRLGAGNVLILARVKEKVRTIAGWMVDLDIPFVTEDSLKLFGNPTVKSLLALLSALVLPSPDSYLLGLVETGFFGKLDEKSSMDLLHSYGTASRNEKDIQGEAFIKDNAPELYEQWIAPLTRLRATHSGYELATRLVSFLQLEQGPERNLIDRFLEEILALEENGVTDTVDIVNHLYEKMDDISLSMPETKDVVRIMTIHKAKGLESPVVIVPFLNWQLISNRNIIIGEAEPGSGKYLQIKKAIADLEPSLGKIYRNARDREKIENINLMYVALTRAGKELYTGLPPVTPKTLNSTASGLFQQMMETAGHNFDETGHFSVGTPIPESKARPEETKDKKAEDKSEAPQPKLRPASDLLYFAESRDEPFEFEARLRGTLLHKAMSFIQHIENGQWKMLGTVAKEALTRAAASLGVEMDPAHFKEDIDAVSRTLLALKAWFAPELPAWNEREFVGSGGEMIRVDRIVKEQSRYLVIDYKTGSPNPRYHNQIKRYLKILRPLEGPVEGMLAYLDSGEVEHVHS